MNKEKTNEQRIKQLEDDVMKLFAKVNLLKNAINSYRKNGYFHKQEWK